MKYKLSEKPPWNIKVKESQQTTNQHIVEVKVYFYDNKLREKMRKIENVYFAFQFKNYWFKRGIKSARVYKTNSPGAYTQKFSTHMHYSFETADQSILFSQGIERALDLFIMEQILEGKQQSKKD